MTIEEQVLFLKSDPYRECGVGGPKLSELLFLKVYPFTLSCMLYKDDTCTLFALFFLSHNHNGYPETTNATENNYATEIDKQS